MPFAVRSATRDRRTDSRRMHRVEPVEVHRHVHAARVAPHDRQRVLHDRAEPALIDRAHGEGRDAPVAEVTPLRLVEIPYADDRHLTRENRRRWPAERGGDSGEHGVAMSEQVRERHPVDVATAGRLGRVRVAMRVEPDDAEPFAALGERNGRTAMDPAAIE
jgi:hypothetical protein